MNVFRSLRNFWNTVALREEKSAEAGGKKRESSAQTASAEDKAGLFRDGFERVTGGLRGVARTLYRPGREALGKDGFEAGFRGPPVDLTGGVKVPILRVEELSMPAAPVASDFVASLDDLSLLMAEAASAHPEPAEALELSSAHPELVEGRPLMAEALELPCAHPETVEGPGLMAEALELSSAHPEPVEGRSLMAEALELPSAHPEPVEGPGLMAEALELPSAHPEPVEGPGLMAEALEVSSAHPEPVEGPGLMAEALEVSSAHPEPVEGPAYLDDAPAVVDSFEYAAPSGSIDSFEPSPARVLPVNLPASAPVLVASEFVPPAPSPELLSTALLLADHEFGFGEASEPVALALSDAPGPTEAVGHPAPVLSTPTPVAVAGPVSPRSDAELPFAHPEFVEGHASTAEAPGAAHLPREELLSTALLLADHEVGSAEPTSVAENDSVALPSVPVGPATSQLAPSDVPSATQPEPEPITAPSLASLVPAWLMPPTKPAERVSTAPPTDFLASTDDFDWPEGGD